MSRNILHLLCILFLVERAECQTYNQLRDSAGKLRESKDYAAAFRLLSEGIRIAPNHPYHNDIYDAAALGSLLQLNDTVFHYLGHLLSEGEYEMITCDAKNDPDFKNVQNDERWWRLIGFASKMKDDEERKKISAVANCISYQDNLKFYTDSILSALIRKQETGEHLKYLINHYNQFPPILRKGNSDLIVFSIKINDTTNSFYEVQLPHDYNNLVSYPILLVLHGAVSQNTGFPDPLSISKYGAFDTTGMNQFFSQMGYQSNTIVVYPHANREFNWMYPDDGFPMVLDIVNDLKRYFNIDDNRVFLSGHSNGATGVISYLLKSPSGFAGFYGFNSNPRIRTGGTFIKNALNRSYFNIATNKDYYFPVSGHDTLASIALSLRIDWQNHVYNGFPHWFPQFKESYAAFELMFKDMSLRRRNPFHNHLYWECDDVKNGRCDWISIGKLDTGSEKMNWQTEINFPVTHWVNNLDTSKISDTMVTAFNYPRLSGAIKANYRSNRFDIETSRIKEFSIFISPDMVELAKPVVVYVNGKELFNKKVDYDKEFMIQSFKTNFDRKVVWANYIQFKLK